ncbi:MAG: hypothetical protein PHQ11_10840 [Paludibacter sp.]|nr:hypothetical protein [Paludibacter sp.]
MRHIKQEVQNNAQEQAIRLEQIPGEAQVDFGEFKAITGTELKTYYELEEWDEVYKSFGKIAREEGLQKLRRFLSV